MESTWIVSESAPGYLEEA